MFLAFKIIAQDISTIKCPDQDILVVCPGKDDCPPNIKIVSPLDIHVTTLMHAPFGFWDDDFFDENKKGIFQKARCVVKVNILRWCWLHFQKSTIKSPISQLQKRSLVSEKSAKEKKSFQSPKKGNREHNGADEKRHDFGVVSRGERERVERLFGKSPRWWWWYGGLTSGWRVPFNQRSTTKNGGGHNLMVGWEDAVSSSSSSSHKERRSLHIKMAANSLSLH